MLVLGSVCLFHRLIVITIIFLCVCAHMIQVHVENLEGQVKEQEAYHNELQEVERWLLQMSSRMVTPDPTVGGSLEAATQQLARHKVINHIDFLALLVAYDTALVTSCNLKAKFLLYTYFYQKRNSGFEFLAAWYLLSCQNQINYWCYYIE